MMCDQAQLSAQEKGLANQWNGAKIPENQKQVRTGHGSKVLREMPVKTNHTDIGQPGTTQ
jgi:hypothetical protein